MEDRAECLAVVHDVLPVMGGAERVLEAALQIYPQAPVYTLLYRPEKFRDSIIANRSIHTSFINFLPGAKRFYRNYLPLLPVAVEQFDLSAYEIVLSFSYAVAHGVMARPDQLHISYTYTPVRQAWRAYHQYLSEYGDHKGIRSWPTRWVLHYLRQWDFAAAARVDEFVAVSHWAARCIWRAYRRYAEVIYPPVDIERFNSREKREDYFITIGRMETHKRLDLIVAAFTRLNLPLIVIGDGQLFHRIRRQAGPTVQMLGYQPDDIVADLLSRGRAYVHAADEDFGLAPVEAQAAGCPVIAFGKGGVTETVQQGVTGILYPEQTVESLMEAVTRFEAGGIRFDRGKIRQNALRFQRERFQQELGCLIERKWVEFDSRVKAGYRS